MMRIFVASLLLLCAASPAQAAWQTPAAPTAITIAASAEPEVPAPGLVATVRDPYYKITSADVSAAVAEQLQSQGVVAHAQVTLNPGTPGNLYAAERPLHVAIQSLQVDSASKRWQAQAYFLADGKTQSVKPVAGMYDALIDVPVLKRQLRNSDVIEQADLETRALPERQLRKDTITDAKALIGQSPRFGVSAGRPIHQGEISAPLLIKRGDAVEMFYSTPYIKIKTSGVALEDGAKDALIRVKNSKSERAVSGRVDGPGRVTFDGGAAL